MKTSNLLRIAATLAVALLLAVPATAQAQADFTTFVTLGDSTALGTVDGCIVDYGQRDAFGAIIARLANTAFEEPLIGKPGVGVFAPGCLYVISLAPAPVLGTRPSTGVPINATLPRPYNNLAVDGSTMGDIVDKTSSPTDADPRAYMVLRGQGTAAQQAAALKPTFLIVSAGSNDILGAAEYATPIDGVTMTPLPIFQAKTAQVMAALKAAQGGTAKGFFVSLATSIPFIDTLSPILGINPATGAPIYALYDTCPAGIPACPIPAGSKLTLLAADLLKAGYGIPCAIAPTNPNCNKPLPDNLKINPSTGAISPGVVLTPAEQAVIYQRVNDVNNTIAAQAATAGYKFLDLAPLRTQLATTGVSYGGMTVTSAFLSGGYYSNDGAHESSLGQAIKASAMVQFIRDNWGNDLPQVDLYPYLFDGNTSAGGYPVGAALSPSDQLDWAAAIFNPENMEYGLRYFAPQPTLGHRSTADPRGMPISTDPGIPATGREQVN